jgi:hypothetical protein
MLLQVKDEGRYKNISFAHYPEMTLFSADIKFPDGDFKGEIIVTHVPPDGEPKTLIVSLQPETADLSSIDIMMHGSSTTGYNMGKYYGSWFSNCFGYSVAFVYIGSNTYRCCTIASDANLSTSTTPRAARALKGHVRC